MSLKVLVLLTLVAAGSASPAPTLGLGGNIIGGLVGNILHIRGSDLGNPLGTLFGNIFGFKNQARSTFLPQILDLKVSSLTDVLNLGGKLVLALGDVIDASISGLGNLVARIVACTLKIVVCLLGSSSNAICRGDWNTQFGVDASAALSVDALIKLYGLNGCRSKVQSLISVYIRGGDIARVKGSISIVLRIALDLATTLDSVISSGVSLTKADLSITYRRIGILLGAIGNSHQNGLGVKLVNNLFPVCNKYFVPGGYPEISDLDGVIANINLGNNDNGPWALIDISADANSGVSLGLGQLIGNVFKGVLGIGRLAVNLVNDIVKIVLNSFDDCITLAVKIVLGLGGALDSTIAGLGSLLVRIVAVLLKIVLCFVSGNGSKYGVCRAGWNNQFGVSGEATSIEALISLYGIGNCHDAVNKYITTYTKGQGLDGVTGSVKILLQTSLNLSLIVQSRKWDKNVLVTVFRYLTYLLGAIGNSNVKGAGTQVCNKFIPACNKFLTAEGFIGFGDNQNDIINYIEAANGDNYVWSADIIPNANTNTGFIVNWGGNDNGAVTTGQNGGLLGNLLGGIFGLLGGVTRLAGNIINEILQIKINALADVFNLVFKLVLGIGGTIDTVLSGLGLLLSRIVAVIFKIGICVRGYPGDRSICNAGWNKQFGIIGDSNVEIDLIALFKLNNIDIELNKYINGYANGKGYKASTGSVRIIFDNCRTLAGYITNYKKINKETITQTFISVTTISASIANANKKDSGVQIVNKVIPTCGPYFAQQGYPDISQSTTKINVIIVNANGDSITWSKDNNGGNSGNTGGNNSGNTGSNTGANTGNTDNTGGNTGANNGDNTDNNTGNTDNNGGNTDNNTGNTDNTGGNTGANNGDKTDNNTGNTDNTGGNTDKNTGNTDNTGGNTGANNGDNTDNNTGNTDNNGGNTDNNTGNTDNTGGNTEANNGDKTDNNTGNTDNTGGNTDKNTGNTDNTGGNTGANNGDNSDNNTGNTDNSGNNGGVTVGGGASVDLGVVISGLVKGIFGVTKLSASIITDLSQITITSFNDVCNLTVKVGLALGGILNSLMIGLGSIFSRMVAVIFKIGVCVNGFPGVNKDVICTKQWNAQFGVNGDASTTKDLLVLFRVDKCRDDVKAIIDTNTNGKGISSTSLAVQIILQKILDLTVIVSSQSVIKTHFASSFTSAITVFGAIANSYKQNSGTDITKRLIPVCNQYFVKEGYSDLKSDQDEVFKSISGANDDKYDWTSDKTVSGGSQTTVVVKGDGLVKKVKDAFKNVKNDKQSTVTAVLNLEIPRSFDDVLIFGIKVIQALGSIIDLFISGLGSLLTRLVGVLLRYIVCIVGASKNKNNFVCQKAYYDSFGVTVSGNTWADITAGFKINTAKADLDVILKKYTNNKGISAVVGAEKICFTQASALVDIYVKGSAIVDADLTVVFRIITTILGGFANSLSVDLGKQICDNMVPVCSTYLVKNGYSDFTAKSNQIYADIQIANNVQAKWTQGATTTVTKN